MRGRHRPRRYYKLRIFFLSSIVVLIAPVIGIATNNLVEALARKDLLPKLSAAGILLACVAAIFLLAWAIMIQRKKYARSRMER